MNFLLGVGILYLLLWGATKLLTEYFHLPGFQSGQYGDGPKPSFSFWARQAAVYVCALLTMKLVVVILFAIWPGIFDIGEWLLSWTGSSDWAQVTVYVVAIYMVETALTSIIGLWGFVPSSLICYNSGS